MEPIHIGNSRHASGIARSLRRELETLGISCSLSRAQETVARMFGHRDWHGLRAASKGRPASATDDQAGADEANARRTRFASILSESFGLPGGTASRLVDAIRPTGLRQERADPGAGSHPSLDRAILEGRRFHVFLSGGGLRVVRVEKGEKLVGYGEAPHLGEALALAEEDTRLGGRDYHDVYGKGRPHYLTGASDTDGEADAWVRAGHVIDAHAADGLIVVEMGGSRSQGIPEEVRISVSETGEAREWEARGMRFRAEPGHGPGWVSFRCVEGEGPGRNSLFYQVVKRGTGTCFEEALAEAVLAEEVDAEERA